MLPAVRVRAMTTRALLDGEEGSIGILVRRVKFPTCQLASVIHEECSGAELERNEEVVIVEICDCGCHPEVIE